MRETFSKDFRRFFTRGLAAILPTILTIAILIYVIQFVQDYIGVYIGSGIKVIVNSVWSYGVEPESAEGIQLARNMREFWNTWDFWLQWVGFLVAIVGIYIIGRFVGSFIGRSFWALLERAFFRLPVIKQIYPSVKQVTDFLLTDRKLQFSRVVAVEYPRKGLWSLGFVTSEGMKTLSDATGADLITVFIPSSPTPVTGYTITVQRDDVIDLSLTMEEALRFTISAGVVHPTSRIQGSSESEQAREGSILAAKKDPVAENKEKAE
ncbi:MAG: DUF502 domain-containing protein [Phycisphaerae bacterium]